MDCFVARVLRLLRVSALENKIREFRREGLIQKFLDMRTRLYEDESLLSLVESKVVDSSAVPT